MSHRTTDLIATVLAIFFLLLSVVTRAQCPSIEAIMVDACPVGGEAENEFVIINSGLGFNTSDFQFSYDASNNNLACGGCNFNNDVNIDIDNQGGAPCGLQAGDASLISGRSNVITVGPGVDIPPGATVIFQVSAGANFAYDFSTLCGSDECVYVIQSDCDRSIGGFTNDGTSSPGPRTNILAINGTGCSNTFIYDTNNLSGNHGDFWLPGPDTYGNNGCVVPPSLSAPSTVTFNNPGDQTVCGSYTLPLITGTNLTGNEGYYTMTGGGGTQIPEGSSVSTTTTIFIFDITAPCVNEETFVVTVNPTPNINTPGTGLEICHDLPVTVFSIENQAIVENEIVFGGVGVTIDYYLDPGATMPLDLTDPNDIETIVTIPNPIEIWATVTNGTCTVGPVSVFVVPSQAPTVANGSLSGCPSPLDASFMLSDADSQFDNSGMYTVTYHNTLVGAQMDNDPAPATVMTSSDQTVFVRITDANGCASTAELLLDVIANLTPGSASLEACDEGGGQATFNLTNIAPTVLNGQSGMVNFYTDMALMNQIGNTNAHVSSTGSVYAVITDGSCSSPSEEIPLTVISFDVNDATLSVTPTSLCGPGNVDLSINTPSSPAGDYTFNVSYGPTGGPYTTVDLTGMDGETVLTISITEDYEFILNSVTNSGSTMCTQAGTQAPVTVDFGSNPTASPASLEVCDTGGGQGDFDLTQLDNTVNGGSGLNVLWFTDMAATMPIAAPDNFTSAPVSVYAVVDAGGGCTSTPAEVILTLEGPPTASLSVSPTTGCGPTDVTLTFNLPASEVFTIDLTTIDGSGSNTSTFNNVGDGSTLDFNISETTTYQISSITSALGCPYTLAPTPEAVVTITAIPTANTSSLSACAPNGTAVFDLTTENNTVNGSSGLAVSWFEDMAAMTPIGTPNMYSSSGGTVYALVTDNGCDSAPAEVTLTVDTGPATSTASLDGCNDGSDQATFNLTSLDNTVNNGAGLPVTWFSDMAAMMPIGSPGSFVSGSTSVYAVVTDAGCASAPVEVTLNVVDNIAANNASIQLCDEGGAQATFDLTSVTSTVNDGTGNTVNWFSDASAMSPIATPGSFTSSTGSAFAVVTDGTCNSAVVTIALNVLSLPTAISTTLDQCDEGGNQATFDLTSVNSTVDDGAGLTVSWFSDMAAMTPIGNPAAFVSGPATVYAIVSDSDCSSAPVSVDLTISTGVTASPASIELCEENAGQATFDLTSVNNVVNNNTGNSVSWFFNANGTGSISTPASLLSASTSVYAVVDDGNCLSEPVEINLIVNSLPTAISANMDGCDDGMGQAIFDLTSLNDEVNDNSGLPVLWTFDDQGVDPIPSPSNFLSNGGDVFATVQGANCDSEPVQVSLDIEQGPTLQLDINNPISCAGAGDGSLTLTVNGNPNFDFDWSDNSLDGQQNPTNLGPGLYTVTVTDGNQCTSETSFDLSEPGVLGLSCVELTPVSTTNGTDGVAEITISGGTPSYDLEWMGPVDGFQPAFAEGAININALSAGSYTLTITDSNDCSEMCSFTITDPLCDLTIAINSSDISCFGDNNGEITVTTNGGTPDFTFDWSDDTYDGQSSLTDLGPGLYEVTVSDALGCEAIASADIAEPAMLTVACSIVSQVTMVGGANGETEVMIGGGTAPYAVSWMGQQTGSTTINSAGTLNLEDLDAGDYTVTVIDDNDCTTTCMFTITEPICDLSLMMTPMPVSCNGDMDGSIEVDITGGNLPLTLTWDPATFNGQEDLMNIPAGTYSLTVTDNAGCMEMASVEVIQPEALVLVCTPVNDPSTVGGSDGSATVEISGGAAPYTIDYASGPGNNGSMPGTAGVNTLNNLIAGNYTITVEDANGCTTTCTFSLSDPTCDLVIDLSGTDPICAGDASGTLTLAINSSAIITSIDWNEDSFDGETNLPNVEPGTYQVIVTDALNCTQSATITINDIANPLLIDCSDILHTSNPSGSDGGVNLVVAGGTADYDISWTGPVSGAATINSAGTFPIEDLLVGSYTITVVDGNNCETSCEFVILNPNCNFDMNVISSNVTCAGGDDGSITLFLNEGTPDFIFDWNQDQYDSQGITGNLTDIPAGFYSLTVTDAGNCIDTATFNILDGPAFDFNCAATFEPSAPGMSDGEITVTLTSAPPGPYTLDYDNGNGTSGSMAAVIGNNIISNLPSGIYTITISTPDLCEVDCEVTLSAGCEITETHVDPLCSDSVDGSIEVTALGGNGNFTYDWSDDTFDGMSMLAGLGAGQYIVTVSDGDMCSDTLTIDLAGPPLLEVTCAETMAASGPANADGSGSVSFLGGIAPYDIQVSGPVPSNQTEVVAGSITLNNLLPGDYTVMLTDGNDCTTECFFTITDSSCTFDLMMSSTDETCGGANDGSAEAIPTSGSMPFTFAWSDLTDTAINNNLMPGTYLVTVADNDGCVAVDSVTINAGPAPPELTIGSGGTICPESCFELPLSLVGTPPFTLNYEIAFGATILPLSQEILALNDTIVICPEQLGIPEGPFMLNSIELLNGPCTLALNDVRNFTYEAPSEGTFSTTICPGDSLVFGGSVFNEMMPTGTVTLPNAASNGCDSLVDVSIDFFPPADLLIESTICQEDTLLFGGQQFYFGNATGNVLLEDAAANGCDSMITVNLSFFEPATSALTLEICPGDTVFVDGMPFFEGQLTGSIVLEDASSNGCDSTINVTVEVLPEPTFDLMTTICPGDTLFFGGMPFFAGQESGSVILPDAAANGCDSIVNVEINFFPEAVSDLALTICPGDTIFVDGTPFFEGQLTGSVLLPDASINGCDSTINVTVDVLPEPTFDLMTTICPGDTLFLGGMPFFAGQEAGTVILPDAAANGCDSIINVTIDFFSESSGLFEATLCFGESIEIGGTIFDESNPMGEVIFENASINGCDSTLTVDLDFLPNAVGSLDTTICFGESLTVGDQVFTETGMMPVVLEGASSMGCDSTVMVTVTVQAEFIAAISGDDSSICQGENATLAINLSAGVSYDIMYSDGFNPPVSLTGAMDGDVIDVSPTQTSTYSLTSATAAGTNCPVALSGTAIVSVSDLSAQTAVVSDYQGFGVSCFGGQNGVATVDPAGGIAPFSVLWSNGDTALTTGELIAGTYTVDVTDAAGCTSSDQVILTAPTALETSAEGTATGCFGENSGFLELQSINGGIGPYEFSLDGEFFQSGSNLPFIVTDMAAGVYTLYVQDMNDCLVETEVTVPAATELQMELGDPVEIVVGDSVLLSPETNFSVADWTWKPTDGLSQPDTFVTFAAPLETTTYLLELVDENGCTVSDIIQVIVRSDVPVFIPNVFSPNGDGNNDLLYIFAGAGVDEVTRFQIYDRWGNQVFHAGPFQPNDPTYGWDGTFQGRDLNAAVYVYFAEVILSNGNTVLLEGDVILVR